MVDMDTEEQESEDTETTETTAKGGGMVKMASIGVGIFVILVAAQIVVPPINQMLYSDTEEDVGEGIEGEAVEGEEQFLPQETFDISELDPAIYTPLDPPLIVSLVDTAGSSRFLQLSVQIMSRSQDAIDNVRTHAPALRNSFLFLISDWTYEDIASLEGKERLRAEMLEEANVIMLANTGEPGIEEIYFTSFVVQ